MPSFFGKLRAKQERPVVEVTGELLDDLADVVRMFGRHAFDLPAEPATTLDEQTERWVRRLLTEASPPIAELKLALMRRRQAEKTYVSRALPELKGALLEALSSLSSAVHDDAECTDRLLDKIGALSRAVETDELEALRERVRSTVQEITADLEQKKTTAQRRVDEMGVHVELLEADLADAKKKSAIDALTGLYNRGAFDADLVRIHELVKVTRSSLCVIMTDIDHFKAVNDTYGHLSGDAVIRACADALVRAFPRKSDYVARFGGEEFVVLLRDASVADAERMTERFLHDIRNLAIAIEGTSITVTCSAGVAAMQPSDAPTALVKRADEGLYRAKRDGRDRVRVA